MNNSKRIYRAAIYVRLSKEDGDLDDVRKAESNSISNQKSLILNYLKDKEDIEIVSIREDDGYSGQLLLGLDSDTFYIYHVAAVMVDNLRRLLLGINLSDKAIMDFDFPGVGFPV